MSWHLSKPMCVFSNAKKPGWKVCWYAEVACTIPQLWWRLLKSAVKILGDFGTMVIINISLVTEMIGMKFFLSSCDFIHILCLWSIEIVSWMLIKFEMGRSWTVIIFPISMPCLCYIYVTCECIIQLWKDFSVFPITTKDTRWVWLITRGCSLLRGAWSSL